MNRKLLLFVWLFFCITGLVFAQEQAVTGKVTDADIATLLHNGQLALILFGMILTLVFIHACIVFSVGAFFKQDWDVLSIASQANIGGATSALALAKSLNRPELQLPAVLVGSLGNAIGSYLGILVAEILRAG